MNKLKNALDKALSGYVVTSGECLVYKFLINAEGQLLPKSFQEPKRGQLAFQTDLMVKKNSEVGKSVPLVIIEMKFGHFTTHDVLTYSAKALKHKEIYPYLRYGFVVGGVKKIDKRFFIHNAGFDFAVAVQELENLSEVTEIIQRQLQAAECMLTVFQGKEVKKYVTNIELT